MRKLKVFGSLLMENGTALRVLVAAYTKKQAMEIFSIKKSEMRFYWSETGNKTELEVANEVGVWKSKTGRYYSKKEDYARIK